MGMPNIMDDNAWDSLSDKEKMEKLREAINATWDAGVSNAQYFNQILEQH